MLDPAISLLAALCGALLFAWAAMHKWRASQEFAAALGEYQLVPQALVPTAVTALAIAETAVCALLLWPEARGVGALAGAAILLLYACAMAINLARGRRELDCGCGFVRRVISGGLVARNVALAALLTLSSLPTSARPMALPDYATIAGALIVGILLYASAELLLARPALRSAPMSETP